MKGNYRERNRSFYKSFLHERGLRRTNRRAIRAFANIPSYLRRKKNQLLHAAFFLHKEKYRKKKLWCQFFSSENLGVFLQKTIAFAWVSTSRENLRGFLQTTIANAWVLITHEKLRGLSQTTIAFAWDSTSHENLGDFLRGL
jgi:hypothetical protein